MWTEKARGVGAGASGHRTNRSCCFQGRSTELAHWLGSAFQEEIRSWDQSTSLGVGGDSG